MKKSVKFLLDELVLDGFTLIFQLLLKLKNKRRLNKQPEPGRDRTLSQRFSSISLHGL